MTTDFPAVRDRIKRALADRDHSSVLDLAQAELDLRLSQIDEIRSTAKRAGRDVLADELRRSEAIAREAAELRGYVEAANSMGQKQFAELRNSAQEARDASISAAEHWGGKSSVGGAIVRSEPRTYDRHNQREASFFVDAYRAQFNSDYRAAERLERSQREALIEHRDITTSTVNGLIPPVYLLEDFAALARAGRPFANVVPTRNLPDTGMSVISTKTTTGTATAVQTTQNSAATETNLVTTDVTIPVVTITGQQDVSRQTLERGETTDAEIMGDLLSDYHTKLGAQWLRGAGSSGESKGILTAATQFQTYIGTTVASFISKVLGAANDVATNMFKPATVVVMTSRRWHWLLAQTDTTGRPLGAAVANTAMNVTTTGGTAVQGFAGVLVPVGLPVIVDEGIGAGFGVSTNEDRVIVTRLEELRGWENPGGPMSFRFDQSVNAPVTVRLAAFGYSAFNAERFTTATSLVVGSGLVAPSF